MKEDDRIVHMMGKYYRHISLLVCVGLNTKKGGNGPVLGLATRPVQYDYQDKVTK